MARHSRLLSSMTVSSCFIAWSLPHESKTTSYGQTRLVAGDETGRNVVVGTAAQRRHQPPLLTTLLTTTYSVR
jgi:hypothetical protein